MRIASISDVHVKIPFDQSDELLQKFINHSFTQNADYIFFLGDIFDLMCGPHDAYLEKFRHFFQSLKDLVGREKRIYFVEGNHDVHLEKLFKKFINSDYLVITQQPVWLNIENKKYLFSHGDEYDFDNSSYHRYKKIIFSPPLKFVANYLMPFELLNFLGQKASVISRNAGKKKFDSEKVKEKFRFGVDKICGEEQFEFVVGGHSHVQDFYVMKNQKSVYMNNGYLPSTKNFIAIENHNPRFISLE